MGGEHGCGQGGGHHGGHTRQLGQQVEQARAPVRPQEGGGGQHPQRGAQPAQLARRPLPLDQSEMSAGLHQSQRTCFCSQLRTISSISSETS